MSLDLILVVCAVGVGLGYFAIRSSRKSRQLRDQARKAMN